MELPEHELGALLAQRQEQAFEQVFKSNFKNLHAYACTLLKDEAEAEEVVQQVFFKLWERAGQLNISGSVVAYLYRAVHNQSLNILKHEKVRNQHRMHVVHASKHETESLRADGNAKELEERIRIALAELPEQCRTIFQLSRFEELRYREIAEKLDISVKTVENQMGKALRILRSRLVDFLSALILFFYS